MPEAPDPPAVRVAMWSGPRNISTALMRSWGSRADTFVCDEPLYGHYLAVTGLDHPVREEVIASQSTDWREVAEWLTGSVPDGKRIFYQKHMSHHLLPDIERAWLSELTNCFLIREPAAMLTSLDRANPNPTVADTGLPQQLELVETLTKRLGSVPPIIDSADVLSDPPGTLSRLCQSIGVEFDEAMLHWEPGRRDTDGVWAPHWYAAVERSSGFEPYEPRPTSVEPHLQPVLDECLPYYRALHELRISAITVAG